MTLKTSFFNMGIYKSTVKRYMWGSVVYFLILFMSTGLGFFLDIARGYDLSYYARENSLILHESYMIFPILMAIIVPVVVALLVLRFLHSKNQAIFTHTIPVTRTANFVSSVGAGFTLMLVPIIANGVLLMLISLCGNSEFFTLTDCLKWIGYNAYGVFLIFSCAVFASCITGNAFAAVGINILIHTFIIIVVSALSVMAQTFIHGYTESNVIYEMIAENNFVAVVFGFISIYYREGIELLDFIKLFVASIILYIASYYLYKNRKTESAGDVAGFKCLNSIFKYMVTFIVVLFAFAVFSEYIVVNAVVFWLIIAIISLVTYTALEMVMKKTLNVLYSWKGYIGFTLFFVCVTLVFSQSTFFGYETRIPQKEDIVEAAIYNYYYNYQEPFVADEEIIDKILEIHTDYTKDSSIPKLYNPDAFYDVAETRLHIIYRLKNGESLKRAYPMSSDECDALMSELYNYEVYKKANEMVFVDNSLISRVLLNYEDDVLKDYDALLDAIRQDYLDLGFEDIHCVDYEKTPELYGVRVEYYTTDDEGNKVMDAFSVSVTEKYKNTVKWFEDNSYKKLD